jgi:hypothetical protein
MPPQAISIQPVMRRPSSQSPRRRSVALLCLPLAAITLSLAPVSAEAAAGANTPAAAGGTVAPAAGAGAAPTATTTPATTVTTTATKTVGPAGGTTPPAATTPAGTVLPTATAPAATTETLTATSKAPAARVAKGSSKLSNGALAAAIVAGLIALCCLVWGVFRLGAFEPRWMRLGH